MKLTISCQHCFGENFNIPDIPDNKKQIKYVRCDNCNVDININGVEFEINYMDGESNETI